VRRASANFGSERDNNCDPEGCHHARQHETD